MAVSASELPIVRSSPRTVRFDGGRHPRAKLGFVLLAMEQTVEDDIVRLAPPGVGVHFSRTSMSNGAAFEAFGAMEPGIGAASELILPEGTWMSSCYTCNVGTIAVGEDRVLAALARTRPGVKATTVMTGVVRGLRALGATRIAVATPYLDALDAYVLQFLARQGFDVVNLEGLNLARNTDVDRVAPDYLLEFAREVDRPGAEALFICCGALRALDVVDRLEREVGKPVVVRNQAMMWDCLRLAGIEDRIAGNGRSANVRSTRFSATV